ncbi:RNA methyltransferase [Variovorax sp. PCZ-1]|uniref:RNA methyltransferase n=1 Tax=Variovorax sp. PCZ-1 TaxID=2835533 RepID=UPI001BCAC073|nr:RNA methyltransferase [Variovorax sp. PCZ-1]MBS7808463.1 RNA methyltransferase [Variovorax sp. PCZ-1]
MARYILINPSHNGNVGAAARSLKTMGFDDLVLVAPRDPKVLNREETIQRASGATDVLSKTQIVATLDEALQGVNHLCATAMTARDFGPPTYAPRAYFDMLLNKEHSAQEYSRPEADLTLKKDIKMAFLFGTERFGMKNEDVYRCHAALSIPTNPQYGSLNLASAVQLVAYDWRQALGGYEIAASQPSKLADAAAVSGALVHWEQALVHLQFLDPDAPKKLMPRLNDLLNRAQLREEEIHILRGIAKAVLEAKPGKPLTKSVN